MGLSVERTTIPLFIPVLSICSGSDWVKTMVATGVQDQDRIGDLQWNTWKYYGTLTRPNNGAFPLCSEKEQNKKKTGQEEKLGRNIRFRLDAHLHVNYINFLLCYTSNLLLPKHFLPFCCLLFSDHSQKGREKEAEKISSGVLANHMARWITLESFV